MKRFTNILCVITPGVDSKPALERAVTLAENNQAKLIVVAVVERIKAGIGLPVGGPVSDDLQAAVIRTRESELAALLQPYRERVDLQDKILVGTPFLEIIREVLRSGHDLVIKTAEKPDWQQRLFGSDDMHLLRKCPCPVWLMRSEEKPNYRRILAAVDFDAWPDEGQEEATNRLILELASSLALSDFAELHVVHAWVPIAESAMRVFGSDLSEDEIAANVERERRERQARLERFVGRLREWIGEETYGYLAPQIHLRQGSARKEIPALAGEIGADLVVMGTVARTGIPGFIIGNTAEAILSQIDCSVLAVKPEGFTTPVTLED